MTCEPTSRSAGPSWTPRTRSWALCHRTDPRRERRSCEDQRRRAAAHRRGCPPRPRRKSDPQPHRRLRRAGTGRARASLGGTSVPLKHPTLEAGPAAPSTQRDASWRGCRSMRHMCGAGSRRARRRCRGPVGARGRTRPGSGACSASQPGEAGAEVVGDPLDAKCSSDRPTNRSTISAWDSAHPMPRAPDGPPRSAQRLAVHQHPIAVEHDMGRRRGLHRVVRCAREVTVGAAGRSGSTPATV